MKKHFLCFKTGINTGLTHSRIDVIGVRDIGGDLSGEVETIAIEVKKEGPAFATTSGQTLGYNVYANRVYLAEVKKRNDHFSWEQMDIARHLGIGLVEIRNGRCRELLSSPTYKPIPRMNFLLLNQLGLGKCQLCGYFFETGGAKRSYSNLTGENVEAAIEKGKGLMFWNRKVAERKDKLGVRSAADTTYERRFVCPECVQNLLAVEEKRLKGWFRDFQLKS